MERLIKKAKLHSFCLCHKYKYGFEAPHDYAHTLELDQLNGDTLWFEANVIDHEKLQEYDVFNDKDDCHIIKIPAGY